MDVRIIWELYRLYLCRLFSNLRLFSTLLTDREDFIPRGGEPMNVYDLLSLIFMAVIAFVAIADYIERKAKSKRRPRSKDKRRLNKN